MATNTESKGGIVQKKVLIRAAPGTVFRALTDAAELTDWFCDRACVDLRVGGGLEASWRHGKEIRNGRAVFRHLQPPALIELVWVDEGYGEPAGDQDHTLIYTIRSRRDGSELLVRDEGGPIPDPEDMTILEEGWISVLRDLKEHCEARERSSRPRKAVEQHT
jgi:uncharacterized protein YndB with AHSA1/START domain